MDLLTRRIGAAVSPPVAHSLEKAAFNLCAAAVQRLFRSSFAVSGYLRVPAAQLDTWERGLLLTMIQIQALIAMPFVAKNAKGYLMKAFEFSRVFLYKWTVNWRFVHEETFLSKEFAAALLAVHAFLLVAFVTLRWTRPSGLRLPGLVKRVFQPLPDHMERSIALRITPVFVTTSILTSMAIGMLCARSLHYQFYAYIAWTTPFLLWRTNLHPVLIYCIWAAQEWAWNVYPSTNASSGVVVGCLAVQVLGVWWGTRNELVDVNNMQRKSEPHRHVD
jgi:alpha-1,3-mannosyltransferase